MIIIKTEIPKPTHMACPIIMNITKKQAGYVKGDKYPKNNETKFFSKEFI